MSAENITIKERMLLHLSRFSNYGPDEIYNVPFDLTQDGIASVLGITRAHSSIELKKLRELNKVCEWLAHIKSSDTKRKVYGLLEDGKKEVELLKQRLESDEISIDSLLDMKRCDPNVMLDSLNQEDRDTFGLACIFREPIPRKTLPNTTSGVIPTDYSGMISISDEVRKRYLDVADADKIKKWHSRAADWYIDNNGDEQEKIFHLSLAGRDTESAKMLIKNAEIFLDNPNEDLLAIIQGMKEIPRFNETVLSIRSKIAVECMNADDLSFCADRLAEYNSPDATVIRAEADIIRGDANKAYDEASKAYDSLKTPSLALISAKALFILGRYDDAEEFLSGSVKAFAESGDVGRADEIMVLKAGIANARGRQDECLSYLNKALRSSRNESRKTTISNLILSVRNGKKDLRFF